MKALIRLVHPFGEPPHWLITPQPETDAEREARALMPDTIRFEALPRNIISTAQDAGDWCAVELRQVLKKP